MTDPIADMLIRIKNAYLARKKVVVMPHSKVKEAVAQVLLAHKYVASVERVEQKPQDQLVLNLSYIGKDPSMTDVKRVSKPGRRMYRNADNITRTLGGYGITIISTSQGVMSDTDARKKNIGGEILCQVW